MKTAAWWVCHGLANAENGFITIAGTERKACYYGSSTELLSRSCVEMMGILYDLRKVGFVKLPD